MARVGGRLARDPGDGKRQAAALVEPVLERPGIDAGHAAALELGHRLAEDRGRLPIDVLVRLYVDGVGAPTHLDGLVDELPGRTDGNLWEQMLDVFRVEPDAAMAHLHPDTPRDVGTVDAVGRQGQLEAVLAERIVRGATGDERPVVAALDDVLLTDRLWDVPLRVDRLADDFEAAARRLPVIAPEPHGVGLHHRRPGTARRVVEEAH